MAPTTSTDKKPYLLAEGDHSGFDQDGTRKVFTKGEVIYLSDESARNLGKKVIGPLTNDELKQLEGEKELVRRIELRQPQESRIKQVVEEVKASAVKTKEKEEGDPAEGVTGGEGDGEDGDKDNVVDTLGETKFATAATKKWAEDQGLTDKDFEGMEPSSEAGYTKEDAKAALEAREEIGNQE